MASFRKPSTMYSALPTNLSEGRLRLLFTKRGITYTGTAVLFLILLSLSMTGVPDTKDLDSLQTSHHAEAEPPTNILPFGDSDVGLLPPIQHDDSRLLPSTTSAKTTTTSSVVAPTAQLPPPSHRLGEEKHTEDGFPLLSTQNNGKLVILTGATGKGNFFEIPNFYSNVVQNRLDYVNHHGTYPPSRQGKADSVEGTI